MKTKILLLIFLFLVSRVIPQALAIECDLGKPIPSDVNQLADYIKECQKKAEEKQGQANTLKVALDILNSKIRLTQAQIKQTTSQIASLEKDVDTLSTVLVDLDKTLEQLTRIYLARVRESYIRRDPDSLTLFFSSDSFAKFFTRIRYLSIIKERDQLIISEMETARVNYDSQKNIKISKQQEVKELKTRLDRQQADLSSQQRSKNDLLIQTKNDEKKYEQLRSDALAQLAAFNKFVANQGGASILENTTKDDGSWGKYYNQRDSLWGNRPLGISKYSVADAGCLITSMAMVLTHYGKSVTPGNIAANSDFFAPYDPFAYFLLGNLTINGINTKRERLAYSKSSAISTLNNELSSNNGKPVIVGIIRYGSSQPEHFIVIKSKDGDDYVMNDPFFEDGMNIEFKSKYSLTDIATIDRVTIN